MALALSAVFLVVVVIILSTMNQARQATVNQRQAFLNQTQSLGRVNQALVTALAQASVRDGDAEIRALLAVEGITATVNPAPGK